MIFEWETAEERLNRFVKIAPQKKLEWLRQMLEFIEKFSTKSTIELKRRLKENYRLPSDPKQNLYI